MVHRRSRRYHGRIATGILPAANILPRRAPRSGAPYNHRDGEQARDDEVQARIAAAKAEARRRRNEGGAP